MEHKIPSLHPILDAKSSIDEHAGPVALEANAQTIALQPTAFADIVSANHPPTIVTDHRTIYRRAQGI